ncbi:zf-HC2 domain-containing protein [Pseudoduganella sp. LjRoot289]|uniref:zf-HC2 domain-containing protein n=1 Tax=Pseudoduganella sp. LjRoot289 TaxID=3342314 RepID=UPI003ECCBF0D
MTVKEDADTHGTVQALLPWFANETLPADEMALVREHLRACRQCRDDAAWQQRLRAAEPQSPAGLDPERALARLMPLLEPALPAEFEEAPQTVLQPQTQPQPQPRAQPQPRRRGTRAGWGDRIVSLWRGLWSGHGWMPWALAGQGVLIAGLVFQLLPDGASDYRALSNGGAGAPPQAGNVVVAFRPEVQMGQVQAVLQAHGARVVDGPTVTGAYVLDVPDASQPRVLAALKADPLVQLAEPLGARRAP